FRESRHRREQTPLTFGIERVEGERRLAGPAHAGDDDQLVARNLDTDVPQIVLTGAANFDGRSHQSWNHRDTEDTEKIRKTELENHALQAVFQEANVELMSRPMWVLLRRK